MKSKSQIRREALSKGEPMPDLSTKSKVLEYHRAMDLLEDDHHSVFDYLDANMGGDISAAYQTILATATEAIDLRDRVDRLLDKWWNTLNKYNDALDKLDGVMKCIETAREFQDGHRYVNVLMLPRPDTKHESK